ncbi:MAG: cysteine--tRNA ligase [Hydrogenibacillus sp.]|nr:cysteine--tRNA ligase [Hydrogenibacillus sp.]
MAIVLFNTLSGRKEPFVPLEPGKVRMYVCGPTVYHYIHIGNGRASVVFDTVRRWFSARGYDVTYVQNYTDIDDRIIRAAREAGETVKTIAERYIAAYEADIRALNVLPPTHAPRVTGHIREIVALIERLMAKGYAYEQGGDVYFRVERFAGYGKLSKQPIEDLLAGARVEVGTRKENPLDFALWKRETDGEAAFPSPWGPGRPGWHIECSAMSMRYLGETFDIHGGGQDLCFPHHENEIAQSEAATGVTFVRYWLHNGHVTIDEAKMSKSLGNVVLVRDAIRDVGGRALRFWYLNTHYRQPLRYHPEAIRSAQTSLERIDTAVRGVRHALGAASEGAAEGALLQALKSIEARFEAAMDDDFNTPEAITAVFDLVRLANAVSAEAKRTRGALEAVLARFHAFGEALGIAFGEETEAELDDEVRALIEERSAARKARDYARADAIRAALLRRGIVLEDTPDGVRVRIVRRT